MSNLNLPTMTYSSISALLGKSDAKSIAYATTAEREYQVPAIAIRQHGNVIARLFANGEVYVTNAGWGSSTTRTRLHAIMREFNAGVTQRNFEQNIILNLRGERRYLDGFVSATFDNEGNLTEFNGRPATDRLILSARA